MLHRFPKGLAGDKVHQKRLPAGAPPWVETVRLHFPRWNRTADELCVTELGSVIWAVQMSTVEFHPWNSRREDTEKPDEWRIDLDPGPLSRLRHGPAGRPRRPRGARRARAPSASRRPAAARACTSTSGSRPTTASRTYAGPRWRSPARSSAAPPTTSPPTWWRKDRRPAPPVRRLQPERPRPHHRGGVLRARLPRRPGLHADPLGRDRRRRPARLHDLHRAARYAELGDLHADIDGHVFDIAPLLEWADRDERAGAEPPADPETAADARAARGECTP